ncbi:YfhO family protein [bacterium]|nr:YfhO family protein [bacterium]
MLDTQPAGPPHRWSPRQEWGFILLPIVLILLFFSRCFLRDEQLIFRDAGHFYYPYFQLQVQQWQQGEIPLWNPHENGGEPLAANPSSTVFYPGKILFAMFPYPWAFKLYLIGHLVLAAITSYGAARRWGFPAPAACMVSLTYSCSGMVLFQVYNIIYLVGAAWLPLVMTWGCHLAASPSLKLALCLSVALAMQILGGDPQTAQMSLLFCLGITLYGKMAWTRATLLLGAGLAAGSGIVRFAGSVRTWLNEVFARLAWMDSLSSIWSAAESTSWLTASHLVFALLSGVMVMTMLCRQRRDRAIGSLIMLFAAGIFSLCLAAIQVWPTLEFTSLSGRNSPDFPGETVAFSLHPARLMEVFWSNFWGSSRPLNTRWFPWAEAERSVWVPNLYAGIIPLLLALGAMRLTRGEASSRTWTWILLVSLLLSFGKFGDGRWLWDPQRFQAVPLLDLEQGARWHGESTGLYWLAEQTIPGFQQFRYPTKLFVFSAWALAMLAGQGVACLIKTGPTRRLFFVTGIASLIALCTPFLAAIGNQLVRALIERFQTPAGSYGPFLLDEAIQEWFFNLVIGMFVVMFWMLLLVVRWRQPRLAPWVVVCLLMLSAIDLAIAHRDIALTMPQSRFDVEPESLARIAEYHDQHHPGEPYRVHRTRLFEPTRFFHTSSSDRVAEQVAWERKTAQPKYGLSMGIDYTKTEGTMNLYDIDFFFAPWVVPAPSSVRQSAGRPIDRIVYYPRTGFDLWNTRYFVLPKQMVLDDVERGILTLLTSKRGEPLPVVAEWPVAEDDCVIFENVDALPRAWVVHEVEVWPTIDNMRRAPRVEPMERLLYRSLDAGIPLWQGRPFGDYPLDRRAMVEPSSPQDISSLLLLQRQQPASKPASSVHVRREGSQRVVLDVDTEQAGLVVLAESHYPGWEATVDKMPVVIHRTNRAMRGVMVPAGKHDVCFEYRSKRFVTGGIVSTISFALALLVFCWREKRTVRRE